MTKIVINRCYGGFGVSDAGIHAIASYRGLTLYPERKDRWFTVYWTIPQDHPLRVKHNELNAKHSKTEEDYKLVNEIYDNHTLSTYDIDRADPGLVHAVETLGDAANGDCAQLEIVELEKGTLYRITEYDGLEGIETRDNCEWNVA